MRAASLRLATFAVCNLRHADLRDCGLTGATFGTVDTGSHVNALTDATDARWPPGAAGRARFDQVIGAPDLEA
jgi:uncharacterized protein YjbI with pentapeptide repeats